MIIAIAGITCYISIFIETDVNEMKKLLLLVDRAYFEVYRDKYEQILEKAVVSLRKKFKDEVIQYDTSAFSKTVMQQQEAMSKNLDNLSVKEKMSSGTNTVNLNLTIGMATMTIDRRRGNLTEKMDPVSVSTGIKLDDNISEDLERVIRSRDNVSSHKRFRSYNKLDKSNTMKYILIICFSTIMILFPEFLDFFTNSSRLRNIRLIESAAYKADKVCTAALGAQSLF